MKKSILEQLWEEYKANPTPQLQSELDRVINSVRETVGHYLNLAEEAQAKQIEVENFLIELRDKPLAAFVRFEINEFLKSRK